jgi:putative ATP-binding cassette transporter
LTKKLSPDYLDGRTYRRLRESAEIDSPDQRISEDIRAFTTTTLSCSLIILNSTLPFVSFSGVLWTISPPPFVVAVLCAALGVLTSSLLGRPLVGLKYRQSDQEADFRSALIHVGENAVPIALMRREDQPKPWLIRRVDGLAGNFRRIISLNRNLSFFITGYNYLIQIIPALIIAPRFIRGEVEFGVITQSTMAFTQLLRAFSLFITQVGSITAFAAVGARLSELARASAKAEPVVATQTGTVPPGRSDATQDDPGSGAGGTDPLQASVLLEGVSSGVVNRTSPPCGVKGLGAPGQGVHVAPEHPPFRALGRGELVQCVAVE